MTTPPTPEPSCAACAFWERGTPPYAGECRRWGPDRIVVDDLVQSGWPHTDPDDWCGEFEAAETKSPVSGDLTRNRGITAVLPPTTP